MYKYPPCAVALLEKTQRRTHNFFFLSNSSLRIILTSFLPNIIIAEIDPMSLPDPHSVDNAVSHLLPEPTNQLAYSTDESPPLESPSVEKPGLIQTWLATSTDLRPTGDPSDIKWGIHYHTPLSIVLLLLVGTSTAITHHLIYKSLHETTVGGALQQRWTLWIGSGLGFLTKVTLTAALGISRTQWVWLTLRKKWFTLTTIDSLFGIISDPTLFLDWEMIRHAKVATVMAIAMWIFPLAAILTSGTISVKTVARNDSVDCFVPTLLFEFDDISNATARAIGPNDDPLPFYTWNSKTKKFSWNMLFVPHLKLVAYTGAITRLPDLPPLDLSVPGPAESPGQPTLDQQCGSNCTYTVQFLGPTTTCTKFTAWQNTVWNNFTKYMNEHLEQQKESTVLRVEIDSPAPGSFLVGIEVKMLRLPHAVFSCKSSVAHYTVQQTIEDRRFLEPVITKVEPIELPDFEPVPIFPNPAYLSSYGFYDTISHMMNGFLINQYSGNSESINTRLVYDIYSNPAGFGDAIELLSRRMVVSMIAFNLIFENKRRILNINAIQKTQCHRTENVPVYDYSPRTLLIVYGLAVACALATSIAGFIALGHNGMTSTKTVSAIMRTTRNRTLDDVIIGGDCLGGVIMSSELQKVKLRFGALKGGKNGTAPFAMGIKGEIYPIKRD